MMSNTTSTTAFGNGLQQHNLTAATIDYLSHNGQTTLATYPGVTTSESGILLDLDKQPGATYYAPTANTTAFYSTQLVGQAPGTILITNNFGPDEPSTISGVNNNFSNSSIRIVTHNNNNNSHTNNNNSCGNTKITSFEEPNCNLNSDKQLQQQQQQYHHLQRLLHTSQPTPKMTLHNSASSSPPNPVIKMPNSLVGPTVCPSTNTSTVVLDRINICINNHYGDPTQISSATMQSGALLSPIIPPIVSPQTTIIDTCAPIPTQMNSSILQMHIEEPDSTTSTHCHIDVMPTQPEIEHMDEYHEDNHELEQEQEPETEQTLEKCESFENIAGPAFEIGEDAFVKRRDGRYYLGTVARKHRQQYLVQFDDKTDYWSNVDELKKLNPDLESHKKPRCLSCKNSNDEDVVEICERCGRGYHWKCTNKVISSTGERICKRCYRPMRYISENAIDYSKKVIFKLPYKLDSLTWDDKHRVNNKQIYCYCGTPGQFDNNMLQCCKCQQWFHARCVKCIDTLIFRGDVFFVFGCMVCNNGKEFLRRIEMNWRDLVHLLLYNMSLLKNFQKYHHLIKDIYPFALENRTELQLSESMLQLSDDEFKANILKTLQDNSKLFICGKEIKKEHGVWSLRVIKPPQGPVYDIQKNDVLCNEFIKEKLKISVLPVEENDDEEIEADILPAEESSDDELVGDEVHEELLRELIEDEPPPAKTKLNLKRKLDDDDDKFTSDDEIPIKQILEQVKSESNPTQNLSVCSSERENKVVDKTPQTDPIPTTESSKEENETKEKTNKNDDCTTVTKATQHQKSSRKRKAFTLSKGYKDSEKSNDLPRNTCDSSSDENSSSSRGTLDLIIPPPKNFLGLNNPFRMLTPKKSENTASNMLSSKRNSGLTKKSVSFGSNSIFTSSLDLNSRISALKSSGLFPNISNSDIAKAAGQPRLVRTIKRRLSAKDIMIGPNQEVRRRRTRPLSSNVEIISTTTINPIPSNFFPIRTLIPESSSNTVNSSKCSTALSQSSTSSHIISSTSSSLDSVPSESAVVVPHGRRLRKRPEKTSPLNSRRNSMSSSSSSNSYIGQQSLPPPSQSQNAVPLTDLKLSVNKYFGASNRIENGEKFIIRAKRRLTNGHTQYLIEWES